MEQANQFRVYLSGPISNIPHEGATGWRDRAKELAEPHLLFADPMDWQEEWEKDPAQCAKRDLGEMFNSHVVLANLQTAPEPALLRGTGAELATWGAWQIMEQLRGVVIHGPAVGIYRDQAQYDSLFPWVTMYTTKHFFDLEKAVTWLNLESSTWTTEGEPVEKPSLSSQELSSSSESPESKILGSDGQPLSSEMSSGQVIKEPPTS